jgi:hypothetical protein
MRVDEERALTEPADIINIESVDSPAEPSKPTSLNHDQAE